MTQTQRIERHMRDYGSITTMEAFNDYGITRLSARIWDLKHSGVDIETDEIVGKNRYGEPVRYARYRIVE